MTTKRLTLGVFLTVFMSLGNRSMAQTVNTQGCRPYITLENASRPGEMLTLYRGEEVEAKMNFCSAGDRLLDGKFAFFAADGRVVYGWVDNYAQPRTRVSTANRATGLWRVKYVGAAMIGGQKVTLEINGAHKGAQFSFLTVDGTAAGDETGDNPLAAELKRDYDTVPLDGIQTFWLEYPTTRWVPVAPDDYPTIGGYYGVFLIDDDNDVDAEGFFGAGQFQPTKKTRYYAFAWSNMRNADTGEKLGFTTRWISFKADGISAPVQRPDFTNLSLSVTPNPVTTPASQAVASLNMTMPPGYRGTLVLTYPDGTTQQVNFPAGIRDAFFQPNVSRNGSAAGRMTITDSAGVVVYDRTWSTVFTINLPAVITLRGASVNTPAFEYRFTPGSSPTVQLNLVTDPVDIAYHSATVRLIYQDGSSTVHQFTGGQRSIVVTANAVPGNVRAELVVTYGSERATWTHPALFRIVADIPVVNPPTSVVVTPSAGTFIYQDGQAQGTLNLMLTTNPANTGCFFSGVAIHANGSQLPFSFNGSNFATITPYAVDGPVRITVNANCGGNVFPFHLGNIFVVSVRETPRPTLTGVMITGLPGNLSIPQGQQPPSLTGTVTSIPNGLPCVGTLQLRYSNGQTQQIGISCGSNFQFTPLTIPGAVTGTSSVSYDGRNFVFNHGTIMTITISSPTLVGVSITGIPSQIVGTVGQPMPTINANVASLPGGLTCNGNITFRFSDGRTLQSNLVCGSGLTFIPLAVAGPVTATVAVSSNGVNYNFNLGQVSTVVINQPPLNACSLSLSTTTETGQPISSVKLAVRYQLRLYGPNCRFSSGSYTVTNPLGRSETFDVSGELQRDYSTTQDPRHPIWTWIYTRANEYYTGTWTFRFNGVAADYNPQTSQVGTMRPVSASVSMMSTN